MKAYPIPTEHIPAHVAIIMDGNGRWAESKGLDRCKGHAAGALSVKKVVQRCVELGVKYLTLYSFSTENWSRPDDEVQALMTLLERYLREELDELMKNRVRLSAIGQLYRLPEVVRAGLSAVSKATEENTGLRLVLALSYGGRAEITAAVKQLAVKVESGELGVGEIDEECIGRHLYTGDLPDPDLLIRTSGELRLSNFLLWQLAYAEIYVTDVLWPDFRTPQLLEAFEAFGLRRRRFGQTDEQLETSQW